MQPNHSAPTWLHILQTNRLLTLCLFFVALLAFAAFGNSLLARFNLHPTGYTYSDSTSSVTDTLQRPSLHHLFGTDLNGRDLFTRDLFGAQISLTVALFGTFISLFVGVSYGMVSGYAGGAIDNLMMRLVDILYAVPQLLTAIIFISISEKPLAAGLLAVHLDSVFDAHVTLLIIALGLTQWMTMSRIVRGQVLVLREQAFVQAAHALGQSHFEILTRHLLPNLSGLIAVYLTLTIPSIMMDESFLSFLGLGVHPPLASWGTLIADAANNLNPIFIYWWLLLFPGLTMTGTLLALNFIGDFLRDRFDPRSRTSSS